jgi:hypothetical protein
MNNVINFCAPWHAGKSLSSCITIDLSRRVQFHEENYFGSAYVCCTETVTKRAKGS